MDIKRMLQIEKRPLPCWLIFWIIALPLSWGTVFQFLSLPSAVKYTADIAWLGLLCLMVMHKSFNIEKKIYPIVLLVVSFFVYCLLLYVVNYQSIIYFLWGVRNNFRFYVFFFAVIMYFRERDAERVFQILDILFWINIPVTFIQYFALGYKQDYLGGIFGVESGANGYTIMFFTIVLSRSLLKYMEKQESFSLCAVKCTAALFIVALAELKFFFIFFILMLAMSAFLTSFSWRKLIIFAACTILIAVTSTLLVTLFGFDNFLSPENIWKAATQRHYSSDKTVNRLSAIPTLAETVIPDFKDRLFGFGLGNCDTSSFEVCNTPFYKTYGHLRYTFFSAAFLFLEVGYLGLLIYAAFFGFCFFMIRKRIKEGRCNRLHGQIALIMSVFSLILIVYNSSLRAEVGYMAYLILALPFIESKSFKAGTTDLPSPAEEVIGK